MTKRKFHVEREDFLFGTFYYVMEGKRTLFELNYKEDADRLVKLLHELQGAEE